MKGRKRSGREINQKTITEELITELKMIDAYDDLFIPGVMACMNSIEDQEEVLDFLRYGKKLGYEVTDETVTMLALYLDQKSNSLD